jgi:CBS domain-containing protein
MAGDPRPTRAGDAMRDSSVSVNENATPRLILAAMDASGLDELPIVTDGGAFRGMVERRAAERALYDRDREDANTTAGAISEAPPVASAAPEDAIEDAVDAMLAADLDVMPVVAKGGQLAGLLVREDLHNVPGLLEVVGEDRRQREAAAEEGPSKVVLACSLASVALGLVLFALWVQGPPNGVPGWVGWIYALTSALAFTGAVTAFAREMLSVPLWAIAGVGLIFSSGMAHAWSDGPWSTWVQLAFGVAFLAMAAIIGSRWPRRPHSAIETPA